MPLTYPISNTERKAGFTLIEMQAVMIDHCPDRYACVDRPARHRARPGQSAIALQTAALFRRARLGAILSARTREVSIDGKQRALIGDGGDRVPIPRDVIVDVLALDEVWSGRQAVVRFLPDGASSGTVERFSREGATYEVRVNWYTGGVLVEPL
jgi:general secretion pathway protein H